MELRLNLSNLTLPNVATEVLHLQKTKKKIDGIIDDIM